MTRRPHAVWTLCLCAASALAALQALPPSGPVPPSSLLFDEILGAQYFPRSNRLLLYVTEARGPETASTLHADDVAALARASTCCSEFGFSLEFGRDGHDRSGRYEIRYLPAEAEKSLREILSSTRVEHTLLITDAALKGFLYGVGLPPDLNLGATELFLCSAEMTERAAGGAAIESFLSGERVTFFELESGASFAGFDTPGVWLRNARLVVKQGARTAGAKPMACEERFREVLENNIDRLLAYRGALGVEFRRLKAVLSLYRVFGWMNSVFVPVDEGLMAAVPVSRVSNVPPLIQSFPVTFANQGRAWGIAYRGGIRFTSGDFFKIASPLATPQAFRPGSGTARPPAGPPGFVMTRGLVDGRWLLQVDISSILGLAPM